MKAGVHPTAESRIRGWLQRWRFAVAASATLISMLLICALSPPAEAAAGPDAVPIETIDLNDLLDDNIRGGQTGGFAQKLAEWGIQATLHGYVSLEFSSTFPEPMPTFDLHHTVLFWRASAVDRVFIEGGIEFDHLKEWYIPFAFMDLKIFDWLILRAGYFPVPFGVFNEHLYPDYLRKSAQAPLFSRTITPALWSEVGLQLRGKRSFSGVELHYALFVVNGLEQRDPDPADSVIPEGGDIRAMRRNTKDSNNADKAVGLHLGFTPFRGLDLGLSAYTGAYTVDGKKRLSLLGADLTYRKNKLTLRLEGALALQRVTGRTLKKYGGYLLSAYRVASTVEPFLQGDLISIDGDRTIRGLVGLVFYPLPVKVPGAMVKLEGGPLHQSAANELGGVIFGQITVGF